VTKTDAFHDHPVFGATEFIGRARLAQNLLSRCRRGQSFLLYGGPKLGKTSMLLHLKWLVEQDRETSATTLAASYVDLSDESARKTLLRDSDTRPAPILLLDNCDHLLKEYGVSKLCELVRCDHGTRACAIVWAGTRAWHDAVREQIGATSLRSVPLAVLFQGEARDLLKPYLAPHQLDAALAAGGTHPYALKTIAHELRSRSGHPSGAIKAAGARLIPFFQACSAALRPGSEQALLQYLVQAARPVAPQEAAGAVGLSTIKSTADALCCLGLISRWNLKDGAMLHANCQLFNGWYLTAVA
jgi:hypothetical protein